MRIETVQMFKFYFKYEGTELMIPLAEASEEEAKVHLRALLLQWANEMTVPPGSALSPIQQKDTPMPQLTEAPIPLSPILELRIEELLKTIADAKLKVPKGTVAKTVKDWTGFEHTPGNFPAIVEELEKIKHG
jgi:hypothetical protein